MWMIYPKLIQILRIYSTVSRSNHICGGLNLSVDSTSRSKPTSNEKEEFSIWMKWKSLRKRKCHTKSHGTSLRHQGCKVKNECWGDGSSTSNGRVVPETRSQWRTWRTHTQFLLLIIQWQIKYRTSQILHCGFPSPSGNLSRLFKNQIKILGKDA